jgi:hypothetical protein
MPDSDYPPHWPEEAVELYEDVLGNLGEDLNGPELQALVQAAELVASASALEEVARSAGYVATGSTGQTIVHPAVVEARLARSKVADVMQRLTSHSPSPSASQAGRSLANKRYGR